MVQPIGGGVAVLGARESLRHLGNKNDTEVFNLFHEKTRKKNRLSDCLLPIRSDEGFFSSFYKGVMNTSSRTDPSVISDSSLFLDTYLRVEDWVGGRISNTWMSGEVESTTPTFLVP